jgi:hypothetical protein
MLTTAMMFAQDTPLEISGSADVYYKYDFLKQLISLLVLLPIKFSFIRDARYCSEKDNWKNFFCRRDFIWT